MNPSAWRMSRIKYHAPRRSWLRDAAALLAIVVVWLMFFWRLFTPVQADRVQLEQGDFTLQFLAFRQFGLNELQQGRWPLWMPCVDSGYPYFADPQSASFYPPAILNWGWQLLNGSREFSIGALELEAALHVLLAAVTAYGFLRGETRARSAAVIGAFAFAFGGYLTGYPVLQLAILETVAWLPLALWAVRRLTKRGDVFSALVAALPIALSVLAGHPQTYTMMLYLIVGYFAYRVWRANMRVRRAIGLLAVTLSLALALSAIQLLPALEFARLSSRADASYVAAGTGLPISDVVQLFVTGVVSQYSPLYVGVLVLVLAVFAIGVMFFRRSGRSDDRLFWLVVAGIGLLLSLGSHLALFDALYWFAPGYQLFRDQERHALFVSWALAVLAAYGADGVLHSLARPLRAWLRREVKWLIGFSVVAGLAVFVLAYLRSQADIGSWPDQMALTFGFLLASTGVLALRAAGRVRGLALGMIVIVALDLVTNNRAVNWANATNPFPTQPALAAIQADASANTIFRLHNEQRLPGHAACMAGLNEVGGITPIHIGAYQQFIKTVPREVRWRLLNVGYVVTWRSVLDGHLGQPIDATLLLQEGEGKDATFTYRLNGDQPRAWIVHEVETKPDRSAIYEALAAPDFDPRRVAYTQTPIAVVTNQAVEPVSIMSADSDRVVVEADLTTPGLLVMSEVNYPGWLAFVNGAPAPIVETDALLRGVALNEGHSRVEMIFRPSSLMIGAALSILGIIVWLGLMFRSRI